MGGGQGGGGGRAQLVAQPALHAGHAAAAAAGCTPLVSVLWKKEENSGMQDSLVASVLWNGKIKQ